MSLLPFCPPVDVNTVIDVAAAVDVDISLKKTFNSSSSEIL